MKNQNRATYIHRIMMINKTHLNIMTQTDTRETLATEHTLGKKTN